ncbi:MAG: HrpE/YscL family type III secretion apparatus protein [Parachlamydiales bacterium]|nr:HrpE/YscL family type III secretion apparatus protein [Parachlamydiales bacterium]
MKLFETIQGEDIHIVPGEKIIEGKEFTKILSASHVVRKVKKEALDYKKKIVEECEQLKENAAREGFQEGLEKFNKQIMSLNHQLKTFRDEMRKKILPIALSAAKKILGEELKLHPERIADIVIQALKPVIQHHNIKIYVNRDDVDILEAQKERIKKILEHVDILSIEEREDIEQGGCIIETEGGIINAQLENQWLALEKAFKEFMQKNI